MFQKFQNVLEIVEGVEAEVEAHRCYQHLPFWKIAAFRDFSEVDFEVGNC